MDELTIKKKTACVCEWVCAWMKSQSRAKSRITTVVFAFQYYKLTPAGGRSAVGGEGEGRKGWEGTSRDAASSVGPSLYILGVNWWFKERLWFRMCVIPKISLQHSRDINSSSPSPSGPYTRPSSPTASATSTSHTKPMTERSSRRRTFVICTYDGNCWDAY